MINEFAFLEVQHTYPRDTHHLSQMGNVISNWIYSISNW